MKNMNKQQVHIPYFGLLPLEANFVVTWSSLTLQAANIYILLWSYQVLI